MKHSLSLRKIIPFEDLIEAIKKIEFRGLYNETGEKIKPYKKAQFSIVKIYPSTGLYRCPTIKIAGHKNILSSPQPTIYFNQTEIIKTVDNFLSTHKMCLSKLKTAVEYEWAGRGIFHILPPIIEKHTYTIKNGFIDLNIMAKSFQNFSTKDSRGILHKISDRYLKDFFIDEISSIKHLDVFHSNAPLINYGLNLNKKQDFYIICDGTHRIDYVTEYLHKPINAIMVEPEAKPLIPYYAFPMPFSPTIRLSSKLSEKMYPRLERDKVHLFNDFLKKILHYDWSPSGLNVSKLRSNAEIY